MKQVLNELPTTPSPHGYKIAIVGDAPGKDDDYLGQPFVGPAGSLLRNLMLSAGIDSSSCLMANLCQFKTPNHVFDAWPVSHPNKILSLGRLKSDIKKADPNLIILLGPHALKAAGEHSLTLEDMRGTFFVCQDINSPFFQRKCLVTYRPSDCIKQYSYTPLLRLDLEKAKREAVSPDYKAPAFDAKVHLTPDEMVEEMRRIKSGDIVAMDIEGYVNDIKCVSFATSTSYSFAVDFEDQTPEDELKILTEFARVMSDNTIGKILQHSLYDNFALSYTFSTPIRGVIWDTMLSGWEIYPELRKSLGMQLSVWTDMPAHKHERKVVDKYVHLTYCCKDSIGTYMLYEKHKAAMNETQRKHFDFNMSLLVPLLYMELKGIAYDKEEAQQINARAKLQLIQIMDRIRANTGKTINLNSPAQLSKLLYTHLKFPKQYQIVGGRKTSKVTTGIKAILNLRKSYDHPVLSDILAFRKIEKIRSYTEDSTDIDGRVRCSYNPVGTDTGRLSCAKSPTGNGANLQTITKKLRHLYRADEGHHFFQIDLSGADGWTVAAHCVRRGDPTMLDDYNAGLKPAKILALLYKHGPQVNSWSREKIREEGRTIGLGDTEWLYFTCKRVQHGTNYLLGIRTMAAQILQDAYKYMGKMIVVKESQCRQLQQLYLSRYPGVKLWHEWVRMEIMNKGTLSCASGHVRRFFGRPNSNEILRAACAHEPQANTTYSTNLAFVNLWADKENRSGDNLIIQPAHQVHDAIIGQFPISRTDWAIPKLRSYMDNPLTIAGIEMVIPYEGFYGPSWGACDENSPDLVGEI